MSQEWFTNNHGNSQSTLYDRITTATLSHLVAYKTEDMWTSDYCFKYFGLYSVVVAISFKLSRNFQKYYDKYLGISKLTTHIQSYSVSDN